MHTLNSVFDKIIVINRTARTDRWANVLRQCEKFGITLERFEAHEATDCLVEGKPNGTFAATSSHRGVLELVCHHKWQKTLILEDDFQIVDESSFPEQFDAMWPEVPADWDWVWLGAGYAEAPISRVNDSVIRAGRLMTLSSYAITYKMARKFTPNIGGSGPPEAYFWPYQRKFKTYVLDPRLMIQADGMSDLTGEYSRNSNSMLDNFHANLV